MWWRKTSSRVASGPSASLSSSGEPSARMRAQVHQRDPVAQRVGLLHVVRGEQHRHPGGVAQLLDALPDAVAGDRVEADRGLVEDEQRAGG